MHVCLNPRMGGHLCVAAFLFLSGVCAFVYEHVCVSVGGCLCVHVCGSI